MTFEILMRVTNGSNNRIQLDELWVCTGEYLYAQSPYARWLLVTKYMIECHCCCCDHCCSDSIVDVLFRDVSISCVYTSEGTLCNSWSSLIDNSKQWIVSTNFSHFSVIFAQCDVSIRTTINDQIYNTLIAISNHLSESYQSQVLHYTVAIRLKYKRVNLIHIAWFIEQKHFEFFYYVLVDVVAYRTCEYRTFVSIEQMYVLCISSLTPLLIYCEYKVL